MCVWTLQFYRKVAYRSGNIVPGKTAKHFDEHVGPAYVLINEGIVLVQAIKGLIGKPDIVNITWVGRS